ncbi:uncharacterized protein DS421_4g121580 [Arachis hypogaea]|nr:uncharacterized protein DS421_4g121580 [Arachis hypogaea]
MLQADNLRGIDPYSRKVLLGRPSALAGQLHEVVYHDLVYHVFGVVTGGLFEFGQLTVHLVA